jgi:hypothetical protein
MARINMYLSPESFRVYEEGRTSYGVSENAKDEKTLVHISLHASEVVEMKELTTTTPTFYNGSRQIQVPYVEYTIRKVKGIGD